VRLAVWTISGLTLAADQFSKALLLASFQVGESRPLLPPLLHLTYVQNTGAAFGLFRGARWLFIACSLLIVAWIVRETLRAPALPRRLAWAYGLLLGGAVGNLIDRVRVGHVIDFFDLRVWPVFNVGDSAITIGVVLLLWHTLRTKSALKQ